MEDAGDVVKFDQITYIEYRGYIIVVSAYGLDTYHPEVKYQIYQSKEKYAEGIDLYDSYDCFHLDSDFEDTVRLAREWVDMYETFNYWTR